MSEPFVKNFRMPVFAEPISMFGHDFHQLAIYHPEPNAAIRFLSGIGFNDWHRDSAKLKGLLVTGGSMRQTEISAEMVFNYQILNGRELEFVSYLNHPHPRYGREVAPFISHLSAYVEDVQKSAEDIESEFGMIPFHRFDTGNHTNPRVAGKKFFREAIYQTRQKLGFDLKLIEKVEEF